MPVKPIVLVAEPIADVGMQILGQSCEIIAPWQLGRAYCAEDLALANGIIIRLTKVTAGTLSAAPKLKVIGRHGVGVDNVDLHAATEKGIPVVFTPSALTMVGAVAEHTVQLMFALARHAVAADQIVRQGRWGERSSLLGFEFDQKTLGVVGLGAIGKRVAAICQKGLGMKLVAYDPYVKEAPPEMEITLLTSLLEVLQQADVVTLHLPFTAETTGLIGAKELAAMKPSALLINAARGKIVDTVALAQALQRGHLFGAALDVFEEEPPPLDHPLLSAPRTLFSPHVASMTSGSMARMAELVARQVVQVFSGERPEYVANPAVFASRPVG
ncbi:MAG TPA: hydroxyacid dehydrogenase [Terriglobia bacterium]|nr:hydroxyacid dehydrogenase [Terriglobia bacterium]